MKWSRRQPEGQIRRGHVVSGMLPSRLHLGMDRGQPDQDTNIFAVMCTEVINGKLWLDCIDCSNARLSRAPSGGESIDR